VEECLALARQAGVDFIVGLGGGSSMDTAKGTNFLLTNGGRMQDYWGVGKASRPMLPLIAIPTTAGTGSECQSAALIADEVTHQKMACLDHKAAARVAILDPVLTLSQPPAVTAHTGVDAIAHAVETMVTRKRTPLSQMYSREAFRLCANAFPEVLASPRNLEARGNMLLGAAFAGMAIENSMLGAAHSAANPLTARFNVVHGEAVGLMLPSVVEFNAGDPVLRELYHELVIAAGWSFPGDDSRASARFLIQRLKELMTQAGLVHSLADLGIHGDQVSALAEEAARQWTAQFNPVPAGAPEFTALFQQVLNPAR
jgi:alcohol dehydrogenase